jgi:hypothetical protein
MFLVISTTNSTASPYRLECSSRLDAAVGAGAGSPIYAAVAEAVRSLLPAMEKFSIASAREVGIEDLEHRLRQEIAGVGGTAVYPSLIGAWARVAA